MCVCVYVQVEEAQEGLHQVFTAEQEALAEGGATAALLKKVKLLNNGDDVLLEVSLLCGMAV